MMGRTRWEDQQGQLLGLPPHEQPPEGWGWLVLNSPLCVPAGSASPCTRPLPLHSISEVSIAL